MGAAEGVRGLTGRSCVFRRSSLASGIRYVRTGIYSAFLETVHIRTWYGVFIRFERSLTDTFVWRAVCRYDRFDAVLIGGDRQMKCKNAKKILKKLDKRWRVGYNIIRWINISRLALTLRFGKRVVYPDFIFLKLSAWGRMLLRFFDAFAIRFLFF